MSTPLFCDLSTPRLYLRCVTPRDRDFFFMQFSDPDVCRYLFDEPPYTDISQADALLEMYTAPEPRAMHRWVLVDKAGGELLGTCGFHAWDAKNARCEVGYDLRMQARGQGYMKEALDAALAFARNDMRVRRIDAHIHPQNAPSVRTALRQGFAFEGEHVTYTYNGAPVVLDIYTLRY